MKKKTIKTLVIMALAYYGNEHYSVRVTNSRKYMGLTVHEFGKTHIRISRKRCKTADQVITTALHEMIHYHQAQACRPMDHDAEFYERCKRIEKATGLQISY